MKFIDFLIAALLMGVYFAVFTLPFILLFHTLSRMPCQ